MVLQGHRVLWWRSEEDLENGRPAVGQLLLQGHAGLTAPSPVDARRFGKDTLVSLFGLELSGVPGKWSFALATAQESGKLVQAVSAALAKGD